MLTGVSYAPTGRNISMYGDSYFRFRQPVHAADRTARAAEAKNAYCEIHPFDFAPERIIPRGFSARIFSGAKLNGWISQYTFASRTRRAISCVYWLPKSKIRITVSLKYTGPRRGVRNAAALNVPQCTHYARAGLIRGAGRLRGLPRVGRGGAPCTHERPVRLKSSRRGVPTRPSDFRNRVSMKRT